MTPQNLAFALLAVLAGALFPLQTSANALLARSVGGPIAATTISFAAGLAALFLLNLVVFRQFPSLSDMAATPPYLLALGGALGAAFLSANVFLAPRLGAAATLCLVIAGQLLAALLVDRLGLFAFAVREASPGRLIGVALVFAGALLVRLT